MADPYYKIDVDIKDADTVENICKRFDINSEKLYAICLSVLKQLATNGNEKALIAIVEAVYNDSKENIELEERLRQFTIVTKEYRKNILDKEEDFFKDLGTVLLDQRRAEIDDYITKNKLLAFVDTPRVIEMVRSMISKIDQIDGNCKADIWRVMINMIKLTEKYRIVKKYSNTEPKFST